MLNDSPESFYTFFLFLETNLEIRLTFLFTNAPNTISMFIPNI